MMLNTVRWSGAFFCGMGEHWSVRKYAFREDGEALGEFFSVEMEKMRRILQYVEWNISVVKGDRDLFSIRVPEEYGHAQLTGELCTAYGTGFDWYSVLDPHNIDLY